MLIDLLDNFNKNTGHELIVYKLENNETMTFNAICLLCGNITTESLNYESFHLLEEEEIDIENRNIVNKFLTDNNRCAIQGENNGNKKKDDEQIL